MTRTQLYLWSRSPPWLTADIKLVLIEAQKLQKQCGESVRKIGQHIRKLWIFQIHENHGLFQTNWQCGQKMWCHPLTIQHFHIFNFLPTVVLLRLRLAALRWLPLQSYRDYRKYILVLWVEGLLRNTVSFNMCDCRSHAIFPRKQD